MSKDIVKCPTCDGCGTLDLAVWAPQMARAVTFLRLRGECHTSDVAKHLDTSVQSASNILRDAERIGFVARGARVGRSEIPWRAVERGR